MGGLTHEEAVAYIHALRNLTEELRCKWLVQIDVDDMTERDRQITNAWLALNEKPSGSRAFNRGLSVITGEGSLYPDPVNVDDLRSALKKLNG